MGNTGLICSSEMVRIKIFGYISELYEKNDAPDVEK
jgi:hypothetical protein